MVKDDRHMICKNNDSWNKAVKIFDKYLSKLSEDVLAEIYEIFQMDVLSARREETEKRELINKLKRKVEMLELEKQILKK